MEAVLPEIEFMFKVEGTTYVTRFDTSDDSRGFYSIIGKKPMMTVNSSLELISNKDEVLGKLEHKRDPNSQTVTWEIKKGDKVIYSGEFQTRNKSKIDLHYHWLDNEDAEKAAFSTLLNNGVIKE